MKTRIKLLLALPAAVVIAAAGCDRNHTTTPEPPGAVTGEKTPDRTAVTSRMTARLYQPGNPFTDATVARLAARRDVQALLGQFAALGLAMSPDESMVVEGVAENGDVTATFIAMTAMPGAVGSGVLGCFERRGELVLAPATFAPSPDPPATTLFLTDNLWLNIAPFQGPEGSTAETQRWTPEQWNRFWQCMQVRAPGAMTACTFSCPYIDPFLFSQCTMFCLAAEAFLDVVHCVAGVTFPGDGGRGRRPRVE
jgi:hypothetical protein